MKEVAIGDNGESVWTLNAGTPRFDHLNDFAQAKTDNATVTAAQRLQSQMADGKVTQYEGNNGKLTLPLPASLTISKNVTAADGLTAPNAEFNFTIIAQAKANETVNAVKTTPGADPATSTVQITFNGEGKANFTLTAGESIEFPGMTNTEYTVVETPAAGFTNTGATVSPADAGTYDNAQHSVAGTVGASDASIAFTNNYSVTAIDQTPADLGLTLTKTIANRDFEQDDSFTFEVSASGVAPESPVPNPNTVTITPDSGNSVDFTSNSFTFHFDRPSGDDGFRYVITEQPTDAHGVDYDPTQYLLVVHVDDQGDGTLEVSSRSLYTIENNQLVPVEGGNAVSFANVYDADETTISINGTKELSGRNMVENDSFQATITAGGSRALDSSEEFQTDGDQPMPNPATVEIASAGTVQFTGLRFTVDDIGMEYRYLINEVLPADDDDATDGIQSNGVTYDETQKEVIVKVDSVPATDGSGDAVRARVFVDGQEVTGGAPAFTINNEYHATGELDGSTNLQVSKTLTGRAWGEDETFTFQLEGHDSAPMPQGAAGFSTVTLNKDNQSSAFGNIVFDEEDLSDGNGGYLQEKNFNYTITENGMDGNGLHYSDAVYNVAVTVTNNGNGTLDVSSVMTKAAKDDGTTLNPAETVETNVAAFINTYTSYFEGSGVSLNGTKVLTNTKWPTGTTLGQGDFLFNTAAQDGAPIGTGGVNRNNHDGKETDTPGVFEADIFGLLQQVTIEQSNMVDEKGSPVVTKDFQYIIKENNQLSVGYTYDESQYRVTITATDDQQGKITAVISKIEKRASEDAEWSEVWTTNSGSSVNDAIVFNNSYTPSDATLTSAELGLTKQLTGNRSTALAEDEFTFTMSVTAADGSDVDSVTLPNPVTVGNAADDTAENGVYSGAINFGDIVFTKAGTFTIHVKENMPDDATENGDGTWTYSGVTGNSADHTFTYKVEDKGGRLVATLDSAQSSGGATFTNAYAATGTESLDGMKNITGRDFEEGDTFTFQVKGTATTLDGAGTIEAPKPSGVSEDNWQLTINPTSGDTATLGFGTVTFTQPGVYTYTFSEYEGELGGMTYDTGERTVVFTVTDTGTGVLNVEVTQGDLTNATTWTNRYQPQGEESYATTGLNGTKTFTGRDMLADEKFEFVLEPATDDADSTGQRVPTSQLVTIGGIGIENTTAEVSGLKNADGSDTGSFDFGNITVKPIANTFDGTGTFKFYVHEVVPDSVTDQNQTANGITYDTHVGTLTLVVTDTDADGKHTGELTITPQFDEGAFAFVNSYEATEVEFDTSTQLNFQKELDGRDWMSTDSFRFQVTAAQGTPMPDGGEQVSGSNARIVTLTSDAVDGTPVNFNLGTIRYTFADMEQGASVDAQTGVRTKTFTYNVAELNTPNIVGVDYSAANFRVEVTVTDDNTGALKVTDVKVIQTQNDDNTMTPDQEIELASGAAATFTNYYHADMAPYGFTGVKVYNDTTEGGKPLTDGMFTFELRPTGANAATAPMPATGTEGAGEDRVCTTTNSGGTFTFNNIEFTQEHDGETFTYEIREQGTDGNGMNFDETVYTATVRVTTDTSTGVAQIKPEVTIETLPESGQMTFTNTYEPTPATLEGADALHGTKTVDGRNILDGETFGFTLAPYNQAAQDAIANDQITIDGNWSDANTATASTTETGSATADFAFGTMTFTQVTGNTPYQFVITENLAEGMTEDNPVKDGLTYDRHQTIVTITVTDNGDGTLKAEATYDNSNGVTDADKAETTKAAFTNVYTAIGTVTGSDVFDVSKTFTGRENDEWTANDVFTFELTGSEGAPMPEGSDGQTKTITVSSDQLNDESVGINNFGDIAYGNADRGNTYTYTIREVAGNVYGVTYSQAEYRVTVKVDDNATPNGQLSIETSMTQVKDDKGNDIGTPADTAAFTNTYKVDDDSKDVLRVDGDVTTNVNGQLVGVGDTLEYTIHWVNDAVDEYGVAQAAIVTVTDNVPEGLTVDAGSISNGGTLSQDGRTITWTIEADAAEQGDVTYQATVDDSAVQGGQLTNTATVQVGDNDPHQSVEATVEVPQKSGENNNQRPDGSIQVGDRITYTIEYANTTDQAADITITDVVPTGVTVDQETIDNGGVFDQQTNTITWTIAGVEPGLGGTVSFVGVVNESAVLEDEIDNQATIQVGENGPVIKTNTVPGTVNKGDLVISKTIELTDGQGTQIDAAKEFEFTIKVADASGNALNGTYNLDHADDTKDGTIAFANGEATLTLKHDESATIAGLPEGAQVTVTETAAAGYTPVDGAEKTATIAAGDTPASIEFVNTYSVSEIEGVPADFDLTKVFAGHAWTDAYSFQFKLTSVDNAPMPEADEANGVTIDEYGNAIKTVTGPQESGETTFYFGAITYSQPGVYYYTVSEVPGENPGIDWSGNEAQVTVTVRDNGDGTLSASASIPNSTFTNTYKTGEVPFDTAAGLQIVKNMTGRAIGAGDFTFTMTGKDDVSIARLNNGQPLEISTTGADLGNTGDSNVASEVISVPTELTFTQEDVGNTYTYTVTETNGGQTTNGVTYDDASYEVKFVVTENGEGTLLVETFVNGVSQGVTQGAIATNELPAQLVFNNSYDAGSTTVGAKGAATIEGTKTLANDDIANYNFTFTVKGENGAEVATGSNNGTETITFDDIVYTTENLNAAVTAEGSSEVGKASKVENTDGTTTYTFKYTVSENAPDADSGVAANSAPQGVTVKVTDNGTGQLSAAVSYDDGDALAFENTYGGDASFKLGIAGNKVIASADGLNKPGLKGGEYEFTIVGNPAEDGTPAPMPDVTMVTNDASGIVNFGPIEYTMKNVFGTDATALDVDATVDEGVETLTAGRSKVFTYTIGESGTLPGVTNEQGTKTVEVTVTDLGGGKIEAQVTSKKTASGTDFTFTNTYNVKSEDSSLTGEDGFSITKKLTANTGRTLADGEFKFVLTDVAKGNVVASATNTAAGEVEFPTMTFDKPGAYKYELSEVPGNAAGVNYDGDKYNVTANVTDMGDGTLAVEWTIEGVDAGGTVAFENTYEADPTTITFGALKTLTGRDMVEGEFTFELTDSEGNTVTTTNGANGSVVFPTVEFTKEGTYEYKVSEALPTDDDPNTDGVQKDGVTYDEKVWTATVNVVDNIETGVLEATVDYGNNGELPVFTNTYTEPPAPVEPDEVIPATGDPAVAAVAATVAIGGTLVAAGYVTSKKRGE
ncbi:Spy0128 family protein [Collinsella intestinalis]|uniref:Spy0128 family protein n=1 Tax=Collinsella intestinalis TaxID=147207 RepID=UPI0025A33941|nr:FctA domain-containing protein [Collinsella intestinalis]MDM8162998.1 FctA domain-containing protein [Collinsella intestinalis]